MKRQSETLDCIRYAGFVTYWSARTNTVLEPSHVPVVGGNPYQRGNRFWHSTERLSVPLLFYLGFCHTPSSPSLLLPSARFFVLCSVEFLQLFQLFHHYLGKVTREDKASSCCCAQCQTHFLCVTMSPSFLRKCRLNSIVKASFCREPIYTWIVLFFESHYTLLSVCTAEWLVEVKFNLAEISFCHCSQ